MQSIYPGNTIACQWNLVVPFTLDILTNLPLPYVHIYIGIVDSILSLPRNLSAPCIGFRPPICPPLLFPSALPEHYFLFSVTCLRFSTLYPNSYRLTASPWGQTFYQPMISSLLPLIVTNLILFFLFLGLFIAESTKRKEGPASSWF